MLEFYGSIAFVESAWDCELCFAYKEVPETFMGGAPAQPENIARHERVRAFRAKLRTHTPDQLIDEFLLTPGCHGIEAGLDAQLQEFVGNKFEVAATDVLVVGSAKTGFSISQKIRNGRVIKPRYRSFSEESDVDLAIVSSALFDRIWEETFSYLNEIGPWAQIQSFEKYFFRGWIRPDKLPQEDTFRPGKTWRDFFNRMNRDRDYTDHRISAGLYRSPLFLRAYQRVAIKECQQEEAGLV